MFLKFPSNFFTLLLAILISGSDSEELDPIVETNYGKLQGFTIDLENNEKADIFLNIPFAKPPVGELRFEVSENNHMRGGVPTLIAEL